MAAVWSSSNSSRVDSSSWHVGFGTAGPCFRCQFCTIANAPVTSFFPRSLSTSLAVSPQRHFLSSSKLLFNCLPHSAVCSLNPNLLACAFMRMSRNAFSEIQDCMDFPSGSVLSFFLSNSLAALQSSSNALLFPQVVPLVG
jgi:hypothetical protein